MNANSKPRVLSNRDWLEVATRNLQAADIPSARLDAELLLCDALGKDRTWLIAHLEEVLNAVDESVANSALQRRLQREPIAYIRGHKEFYGRNFTVTTDTLIPRPETETLVELLKPLATAGKKLVDVGTGSGAIAITAKLEYPGLNVDATDVSKGALEVARKNATTLGAEISFHEAHLLEKVSGCYDIVCANLPYVDRTWEVSVETRTEPDLALYADDDGLALIKQLIKQTSDKLQTSGYLLLEADPRQHDAIIAFGHNHSFDWYQAEGYIVVLQKN